MAPEQFPDRETSARETSERETSERATAAAVKEVVYDGESDEQANERIRAMRRTYALGGLAEGDLSADWVTQFRAWLGDAERHHLPEPNAMVVATATADARPSARHVLLKGVDERGFVFYTNLGSRKASEIAQNPQASLVFPWYPLERQVLVGGVVEPVNRQETQAYWASRPRPSRLGAWASHQSSPVTDRAELDRGYADVEARFADTDVPLPDFWGGLRVVPDTVEFWQGRIGRLHDRLRYVRDGDAWRIERLAP